MGWEEDRRKDIHYESHKPQTVDVPDQRSIVKESCFLEVDPSSPDSHTLSTFLKNKQRRTKPISVPSLGFSLKGIFTLYDLPWSNRRRLKNVEKFSVGKMRPSYLGVVRTVRPSPPSSSSPVHKGSEKSRSPSFLYRFCTRLFNSGKEV